MTFWIIDDEVPQETVALLTEAARIRSVPVQRLKARTIDWSTSPHCEPGDLLYCPATSAAAHQAQLRLWVPGVATFHTRADGVLWQPADQHRTFETFGIPTPPSVPCTNRSRAQLRAHVELLGGLPIVVRVDGGEGGVGVMLADSWPVLHGLVDHLLSTGTAPLLVRFVPDAVHWRVVVVGDRAVTAYINRQQPDDFRSYASDDPADYTTPAPPEVVDLAVRATHVLGLELGGVDVLTSPSTEPTVLEVNFPFYSPQAEQVAGAPIALAMVDHLLSKVG